jgi:tRNA 2-thiouridine synthesizing protein A
MDATIAVVVDARGLACPLPVMKLTQAMKGVAVDAVIELLSTDPGSTADLEAYERNSGHAVLERSQAGGVFRFLVQRKR